MDLLYGRIELPEPGRYMEKIKWESVEMERKLATVKERKLPG